MKTLTLWIICVSTTFSFVVEFGTDYRTSSRSVYPIFQPLPLSHVLFTSALSSSQKISKLFCGPISESEFPHYCLSFWSSPNMYSFSYCNRFMHEITNRDCFADLFLALSREAPEMQDHTLQHLD